MKIIGLLGGMSWESTVSYYQIINRAVNQRLGGLHSAQCLLYSVDFQAIEDCQKSGQWEKSGRILAKAGQALERGGAEVLLICTNTMHKVFDQVRAAVSLPLIHIADATAEAVLARGLRRVGLLGTAYTMEQTFYKEKIMAAGIEVIVPPQKQRREINRIIFEELCHGVIAARSREFYLRAVEDLAVRGCAGIIMGCTEIGLLLRQSDTPIPLFDTTEIHALSAVAFALTAA
ncbi:aspartate/glutamate racemase family protein [Desulfovibrio legallii]|uniref:Aspartate/glutamate racemase family protein n=1 Tax=Desulfovibrio legallii TaxID=571438 RepID=A0A6H3FF72_9BACT|nr:aspartate/glutamate racemase family protein [Desulfovibrio legallii]RHH24917.1 aspartate/glutamate racemase family protein [Desulfovibrio sp. AM18-2]TBH80810.1 aspartate/glutamate racemase family protein [Desulfovibrio legallii]